MKQKNILLIAITAIITTIILIVSYFVVIPTFFSNKPQPENTITNTVDIIKERVKKSQSLELNKIDQNNIRLKENYNKNKEKFSQILQNSKQEKNAKTSIVAIFDTGIDGTHEELKDSVIYEDCFSSDNSEFQSLCSSKKLGQNNNEELTSSSPCYIPEDISSSCNHGTKVASLLAGKYSLTPNTKLISFKIYSLRKSDSLIFIQEQDFQKALIKLNQIAKSDLGNNIAIQALNLSWNTGEKFSKDCNQNYQEIYKQIEELRLNKVTTFVSAGNDGYKDQVTYPACLSNVINIGSLDNGEGDTNKGDISDFSNYNNTTKFANGRYITTAFAQKQEDNNQKNKDTTSLEAGTSFATPLVTSLYTSCLEKLEKNNLNNQSEECLNIIFVNKKLVLN